MKKLIAFAAFLFITLTISAQSTNKFKVGLGWDRNPEPDVSAYIVYWGTNSGIYRMATNVGNITHCSIPNINENVRTYFTVTAVNTAGLESDFAVEISVGSTLNFTNLTSYPASSLTATSTVLSLMVVGTTNPVNAWFRYGTNETNLNLSVGKDDLMPTNGVLNYSETITNLTAQTYYYRSFCWMWTNGIGIYSTPPARFDLDQKPAAPTSIQIFKVESIVK